MSRSTLAGKVGIASLIMMASVFLSKVIGLVREMIIAWAAGAGRSVDAYQVAFVLPEILNHVVASGFLSVTFIPIFTRHMTQGREEDGWRIFSLIITVFGSGLVILIAVACAFTPSFLGVLAPGMTDPAVFADAVFMTRIILPAQFFFFMGGMLMAVQFSKGKFTVPAMAPLIYNLGIILGGIWLSPKTGMAGFSWGVLAGAFIGNFLLQWWGASRCGMRFQLQWRVSDPELFHYLRLTLPLMVGLTMSFSTEIFLKFFGSYLPAGSISGLNYGLRVMLMCVAFFGQAVGMASFPFLARLVAENRMDEVNRLLNGTLRSIALVIPISVLIMVLRREFVTILFHRGRFDIAAVDLTANVLIYLMIGAFAFAAQTVVVRGFYAVQNTLLPAILGSLAVLLTLPVYFAGMKWMGAEGIAIAVSVSAMVQVLVLFVVWNRKGENHDAGSVYRFCGQMIVVSLPIGFFLELFRRYLTALFPGDGMLKAIAICAVSGGLFLSVFVAIGAIFKIPEIVMALKKIFFRLGIPVKG